MMKIQFIQDEENVKGFYHIKTKINDVVSKKRGAIDLFLKNSAQTAEEDNVDHEQNQIAQEHNKSLFRKQEHENSDDFNIGLLITVKNETPENNNHQVDVQDQISPIEVEIPKKKSNKAAKQTAQIEEEVQHALKRPQVVKNALKDVEIFCSEKLNAFTPVQFKEYVKQQGGKVINKRNGKSIVIYNVIKPQRQQIERIMLEDEFYQYLVKKQIQQFEKEFTGVLKKNYKYIRNIDEIQNIVNNLEQLPYPECMNVLTAYKINQLMKQHLQKEGIIDSNGKFIEEQNQQNEHTDKLSSTQDLVSSSPHNHANIEQQDDNNQKNKQPSVELNTANIDSQSDDLQENKIIENGVTSPMESNVNADQHITQKTDSINKQSNEQLTQYKNTELIKDKQQVKKDVQEKKVQKIVQQKTKDEDKLDVDIWKQLRNVQPSDMFDGRFNYIGQNKFVDRLSQSIAQRELFILSGPVGSGKTLLLSILLKNHGYNVETAWDATTAITKFKGSTLFQSSNPLAVILRNIQHCGDLQVLLKGLQGTYKGKNYIVCTSDNVYNQKLKTIKNYLKEIRLPQLDTENAIIVTSKMLRPSYKNYPPAQQLHNLAKKLAENYRQDIRECLIQFGFYLFSQQFNQSQELFTTPTLFEIVDKVFTKANQIDMMQTYYNDPMMIHAFLIQNYLKMVIPGKMQVTMMSFLSNSLSDADVEQYRMYKLSDWSGFPMAQQSVMQIAAAKAHIDKKGKIDFPAQVLQLKQQQLDYWYNDDQLLSPYENITATELGLHVLDASFYLGLDPEYQEDQELHMGFGNSFSNVLSTFKLKYCVGAKKTQLNAFIQTNTDRTDVKYNKGQKKR